MSPTKQTLAALALGAATLLAACSGRHGDAPSSPGGGSSGALTIKGSDTMVILAQRWAEELMRRHPDTIIQVSGGGSGTGIAALINGTTDLATASRPISESERRTITASRGAEPHETRVALDALAVYVHRDNPLRELRVSELARIYRGHMQRWSELGGPDRRIIIYSRENNSGTYAYFKEHVLEHYDFAASAQTLPGTAAVINAVAHDRYGIGYGGIGFAEGIRALRIAADGGEAVAPNLENATRGIYPLARYLYVYSIGEPSGLAADFLAFARSIEGQRLVEATGFYPLPLEGEAQPGQTAEPTLAEAR